MKTHFKSLTCLFLLFCTSLSSNGSTSDFSNRIGSVRSCPKEVLGTVWCWWRCSNAMRSWSGMSFGALKCSERDRSKNETKIQETQRGIPVRLDENGRSSLDLSYTNTIPVAICRESENLVLTASDQNLSYCVHM